MCFIERETQNFILKFKEIFLWRETVLGAHGMKSDEKLFLSNLCDWQVFLYFWKPEAITDSPLNLNLKLVMFGMETDNLVLILNLFVIITLLKRWSIHAT